MTTLRINFEISQMIKLGKDFIELDVPAYGSPKIAAYVTIEHNNKITSGKYILVSNRNKLQLGGEEI